MIVKVLKVKKNANFKIKNHLNPMDILNIKNLAKDL